MPKILLIFKNIITLLISKNYLPPTLCLARWYSEKKRMWGCLVPDLTHSHILFSIWPSGSERSASLNPQDSWVISLEEVPVELSPLDAYNPLTLTDAVSHFTPICIMLTREYVLCLPCCCLIKVTFRNKSKNLCGEDTNPQNVFTILYRSWNFKVRRLSKSWRVLSWGLI